MPRTARPRCSRPTSTVRPRDRQQRPLVRRGRCAARGGGRPSTPPASRCTCTRSATAASREALDAFEGTRPERRHHIAHLQLVHPDDVRGSRRSASPPTLQTLWACQDEQMTELTLPFLGEERSSWQYPFGDLHRAGARLVAGQRLAGEHARPARRRSTSRSTGRRTARTGRPARRSCPSRRCPSRSRSRRTPPARRGSTTATSDGPGSWARVRRPTSWCSTATRSRETPAEIGATRGRCPPGSTARSSTGGEPGPGEGPPIGYSDRRWPVPRTSGVFFARGGVTKEVVSG